MNSMNSALIIFMVTAWLAIADPVNSLNWHQHPPEKTNRNAGDNKSFSEIDELHLSPRSLKNGANKIPELDVKKAITSVRTLSPIKVRSATISLLAKLERRLSFVSPMFAEFFGHIKSLMDQSSSLQRSTSRTPSTRVQPMEENFIKESLLAQLADIPDDVIAYVKGTLYNLQHSFGEKELNALISNILFLLNEKANLKNYAYFYEEVVEAWPLDKPSCVQARTNNIPVPTRVNPVVYFDLIDEKDPNTGLYVKMELKGSVIFQTVLIGESNVYTYYRNTIANNPQSIEKLYNQLPIFKNPE